MNIHDIAIARQVAHEVCATFLEKSKKIMTIEQINQGSDFLVKWCLENNPDKDTRINKQAALKRAVLLMNVIDRKIDSLKDILDLGKENYNYYVRES